MLLKEGLHQPKENPCLFCKIENHRFLYCGIHVDVMVIIVSNEEYERQTMEAIEWKMDIQIIGRS